MPETCIGVAVLTGTVVETRLTRCSHALVAAEFLGFTSPPSKALVRFRARQQGLTLHPCSVTVQGRLSQLRGFRVGLYPSPALVFTGSLANRAAPNRGRRARHHFLSSARKTFKIS